MSTAILQKTMRETWLLLVLLFVAVVGFEVIFVWAVSSFAKELTDIWFKFPFLKTLISALAGADLASEVTTTSLMALGLAHPVIYAMTWAFILTVCTRVIVGEIDRGTADLLLTLPNSRASIYGVVSLVWALTGLVFIVAPWIGIAIGKYVFKKAAEIDLPVLWNPLANLLALYLSIGCVTLAISAFLARRGLAIGIVLGLLIVSFILNFVTTFVRDPAYGWLVEPLRRVNLLNYYRPLESIRARALPWNDILTLLGLSGVAWTVGLMQFRRRDIPAS